MTRIVSTADAYHRNGSGAGRGYGSAQVALPASARALIESGRLAHCVTLDPDGGPQVSAVWLGLDGDEIVMAHMGNYRKLHNLLRDPRIALSLDSGERNEVGMQYNLVIHGTAEVTEGGAAEWLKQPAKVYAGPDAECPLPADPPPGFVVRITVERTSGVGPWNER